MRQNLSGHDGTVDIDPFVNRGTESVIARAVSWIRPPMSTSRQFVAGAIGSGAIVLLTWVLTATRGSLSVATALILYLPIVVVTTVIGGPIPGLGAAIASPTIANWFLVPPYRTFRVGAGENIVELGVFVFVAFSVALFASRASRREQEAVRARSDAVSLSLLFERTENDEVAHCLKVFCDTFDLDAATLIQNDGVEWSHVGKCGVPQCTTESIDLDATLRLDMKGATAIPRGDRLFAAFASELARSVDRQRLQRRALEAEALARADELRTALLRSVSHDLRTPLAGIKAAVSGLLQDDVTWTDEDRHELLSLVDAETDRLTSIVTNLLDLSRLQAGVVSARLDACSLEDVLVDASSDPRFAGRIEFEGDVDCTIRSDPALLTRVVGNLLENAVKWSPVGRSVAVKVGTTPVHTSISVIDHGPGIHDDHKPLVVKPFHRTGDAGHTDGLGLGLAIVDRLVSILGGHFDVTDSPGGGLTAVVTLPNVREDGV